MNNEQESNQPTVELPLQRALDRALLRSLRAPTLPSDFRFRLSAAMAHDSSADIAAERSDLERKHQLQLTELRRGYVRVQLSTLGTLIGAAFACGVAVTLAMPWLLTMVGDSATLVMPVVAGLFVLGIVANTLTQRVGWPRWLTW